MAAPIYLEENSKIRHIASLRAKEPDMRFFTLIVEHGPGRWETSHVVHLVGSETKECHIKKYASKEEAMEDFHGFRAKMFDQLQDAGIEFVHDEYPIPDMPQDKQISYLNEEFGKEMGFMFNDRKGKK